METRHFKRIMNIQERDIRQRTWFHFFPPRLQYTLTWHSFIPTRVKSEKLNENIFLTYIYFSPKKILFYKFIFLVRRENESSLRLRLHFRSDNKRKFGGNIFRRLSYHWASCAFLVVSAFRGIKKRKKNLMNLFIWYSCAICAFLNSAFLKFWIEK